MKNLKKLTDTELHDQTKTAARSEKNATFILLEHLEEVDSRRLYALYAYPSLWAYVIQELGFSESQSFERINAMKLMRKVPEVKTEIQNGNLTLSAAAKLGSHVRKVKLNGEATQELLQQTVGKSVREIEKIIHPEPIQKLTFEVDDEFLNLLQKIKELKGPIETKDLLKSTMKEFIKNTKPKESLRSSQVQIARTRYIPKNIKFEVRKKSNDQCEFISPLTHVRCNSKANLQLEHCRPFAKGGVNSIHNLKHFCPEHNRYAAIRQYGRKKMNQYLMKC